MNSSDDATPRWQRDPWPDEIRYLPRRNRVFIISGPAGVGKDALIKELLARAPGIRKTISFTTKPLTVGKEAEGVDYRQRSASEFAQLIARGDLLEWAEYAGFLYGTPVEEVRGALANGLDVLLKIEAEGAMKVKSRLPGTVLIFIAPDDKDELLARMRRRRRETPEKIAERLAKAEKELALVGQYDYVVVNQSGRLGEAVAQVMAIVEAERHRTRFHPVELG